MKVTIIVDSGDQEVEITRHREDATVDGGPVGLAKVLDLAVADIRRACDLPAQETS